MTDAEVKLLEKLSEKVGTAGGAAWDIMVSAATTSAIGDILQYAILAIVVVMYVKFVSKDWNGRSDFLSDNLAVEFLTVIAGIILAVLCIAAFFSLHDTVMAISNPQYWALKKLLATCK